MEVNVLFNFKALAIYSIPPSSIELPKKIKVFIFQFFIYNLKRSKETTHC